MRFNIVYLVSLVLIVMFLVSCGNQNTRREKQAQEKIVIIDTITDRLDYTHLKLPVSGDFHKAFYPLLKFQTKLVSSKMSLSIDFFDNIRLEIEGYSPLKLRKKQLQFKDGVGIMSIYAHHTKGKFDVTITKYFDSNYRISIKGSNTYIIADAKEENTHK